MEQDEDTHSRSSEIREIRVVAEDLPKISDSDGRSVTVLGLNRIVGSSAQEIFVTRAREHLEQAGLKELKATHLVTCIHESITENVGQNSPVSITPSTPQSAGTEGFRYTWDQSVHEKVLPIRCKNAIGELHKDKFGSGGRGRCIKSGDQWYSPSEFEALGGRGSSKDWKRSIRYGGRMIQCLIDEGILQPHATSCTCNACCDDAAASGPVRLFVPYKRRKVAEGESLSVDRKSQSETSRSPPPSQQMKDYVVTLTPTPTSLCGTPTFTPTSETIQIVSSDNICGDATSEILTPVSQASKSAVAIDYAEQKQWWQLEEMVGTIINYGQQLKQLLEQTKQHSLDSREFALQNLRDQLEAEKKEAVNVARSEVQQHYQRLLVRKGISKDLLRPPLNRVRAEIHEIHHDSEEEDEIKHCANCNREAFAECTNCHKVNYCSAFCQRKDWSTHEHECQRDKGSILLIHTDSQ